MKRFLFSGTLVFVLVVATLGIGEYIVRQMPNPYKTKHAWMTHHADEVETLFLGSSHAFAAIRPEYIPHSFNLANSSQNLKYDYFMLEQYGERCKRLKTVVLPISYFTFFSQGFEESDYWWRVINYAIYMDCDYHSLFSKYHWEVAHPSVYRGKLESLATGAESRILCDSLGWSLNYNVADKTTDWDDATATLAYHTKKDFSFLDTNLTYFNKIASFCREHSVQLILITTPTWHTYYEHLNPKQLDSTNAVVRNMQEKYALPYFDYLQDPRFLADDFFNADHLSDLGAEKFTKILREDIDSIALHHLRCSK